MREPGGKINTTERDDAAVRPLLDLADSGLLWLINASVFHPRGLALALRLDQAGEVVGWQLSGDGLEPWQFAPGPDVDAKFAAANATLADHCRRAHIAAAAAFEDVG